MSADFDQTTAADGGRMDEYKETREEFIVRCLNSAVDLYGIVTVEEFLGLYSLYAKSHDAPISDLLGEEELEKIAEDAINAVEDEWSTGMIADEVWFRLWTHPGTGERLVVYWSILDVEEDDLADGETLDDWKMKEVDFCRGKWQTKNIKILSEDAFLCYDDPNWGEDSDDIDDLARFMSGSDDIDDDENMGLVDANSALADLRINGPTIERALDAVYDQGCDIFDEDSYCELVEILKRIIPETRSWLYRGHTQRELVEEGVWSEIPKMSAPPFKTWEPGQKDAWDTGRLEDSPDYVDSLPRPISPKEPFDFKKVKDSEWRAKTVQDYEDVRQLTADFVREVVIRQVTEAAREAAAKRLGFSKKDMSSYVGVNLDMVVGDFASMMDDQDGEPAIKRILAKKDSLAPRHKFAAEYYEQYRYTWLEVLALKSGCGMKCRDLMTGKELFLMEKSFSLNPNVRGMTICAGIAPMGEVYMSLGVIHPANFENPAAVLKIVLSHLGIPSERPITLSFSDQARFTAETVIHADAVLGVFADVHQRAARLRAAALRVRSEVCGRGGPSSRHWRILTGPPLS